MNWDDQLESELKHLDCEGFREGFAGRTMEALNRSLMTGEPYVPFSMEACITQCYKKIALPAMGLLVVLLLLNFGINFDNAGSNHQSITENELFISEDVNVEDWLESVSHQIVAGLL